MKTNRVARTLQIFGWLVLALSFISLIFLETKESVDASVLITVLLTGFISSVSFEGFAEIIELLYINGKKKETIIDFLYLNNIKQDELLDLIRNKPTTVKSDTEKPAVDDFEICATDNKK